MEVPRQCDSGLAEGTPLSSWALFELVGRNRALFGFIGNKNRPSSDIGREFGGDARELGRESNQRRSENNDSNSSYRDAYVQRWHLEILEAAGYVPASLVDASLVNTMSYNIGSGGGGNCTRVLSFARHFAA